MKTHSGSRTQNFRARLEVERKVISIVNNWPDAPTLMGLTEAGITAWKNQALENKQSFDVEKTVNTLLVIATRFGVISDNSRAIVSEVSVTKSDDEIFSKLENCLNPNCCA